MRDLLVWLFSKETLICANLFTKACMYNLLWEKILTNKKRRTIDEAKSNPKITIEALKITKYKTQKLLHFLAFFPLFFGKMKETNFCKLIYFLFNSLTIQAAYYMAFKCCFCAKCLKKIVWTTTKNKIKIPEKMFYYHCKSKRCGEAYIWLIFVYIIFICLLNLTQSMKCT